MTQPELGLLTLVLLTYTALWALLRERASIAGHRQMAVAFVLAHVFLPPLAQAAGVISARLGAILGLALLALALLEVALLGNWQRPGRDKRVRWAWVTLGAAVAGTLAVDLVRGRVPDPTLISLLMALIVLERISLDRELVEKVVIPGWLAFSLTMLALLPFGVLNPMLESRDAISSLSGGAYTNPIGQLLSLSGRWSGVFMHPNSLGAFAAMGVGLSLCRRRPHAALLVTSVVLLATASSRTAAMAATAAMFVFALMLGSRAGRALAILVGGSTAAWVLQSLLMDESARDGVGRFAVWASVPGLVSGNWVLGLGPDAGLDLAANGLLPSWAAHVHNLVLENLLLRGIVGVALICVFVVALVRAAVFGRHGIPLLVVVLVLATGDNIGWLDALLLGCLPYACIIALGTDPVVPPSPPGPALVQGTQPAAPDSVPAGVCSPDQRGSGAVAES